jgi:RNA polymerase sigma-70 factor, ECF subfamily
LHNEHTDTDLIAATLAGDTAAFGIIVRRYERAVAATIRGMLGRGNAAVNGGNSTDVEIDDIGQQVFIRFYESLAKFRGESSVKTYLTRIAINLSLNELKRRKRRFSLFRPLEDVRNIAGDDGESNAGLQSETAVIEQAMEKLSSEMREVVVLRLVNEYSTEETAQILQIPLGTVLSRLSLARKKLRTLLTPHFGDDYAQ